MSDHGVSARPRRRLARAPIKIVATVLGIGGAIALLLTASMKQGRRVLHARRRGDRRTSTAGGGSSCRCTATSSTARSSRRRERCSYRFKIESRPPARPRRSCRDLHRPGPRHLQGRRRGRRARGSLTPDNQLTVIPDGIMAKCPSKYNADGKSDSRSSAAEAARRSLADQAVAALGVAQAVHGAEPAGAQRRIQRRQPADHDRRRRDADHLLAGAMRTGSSPIR